MSYYSFILNPEYYLILQRQKWAAPPQGSSSSSVTISASSLLLSPLISTTTTTALSFPHSIVLLLLLLSHQNSNSKPHNNSNTFTPNLHNLPSLGPTIHGQSFPDFFHTSPPPATHPPPMVFLPPENYRRLKSVLVCLSLEIDLTFSGLFLFPNFIPLFIHFFLFHSN